jgi:hypothetical protein
LNWKRWELVGKQYDLTGWKDLCLLAAAIAREALIRTETSVELMNRLARKLEADTEVTHSQWQSRVQALNDRPWERSFAEQEMNLELEIRTALLTAVKNPRIRIDSAGAIFLSQNALE